MGCVIIVSRGQNLMNNKKKKKRKMKRKIEWCPQNNSNFDEEAIPDVNFFDLDTKQKLS